MMKIKVKKRETAIVEFSKKDLIKYFETKLEDFNLEGYNIESIKDKTRSVSEPGGDPPGSWDTTYFDGLTIHLEKTINLK